MPIEFDTEQNKLVYPQVEQKASPSIIDWLVKTRLAASPESANKILVVVMIILFSLTAFLAYYFFFKPPPPLSPDEQYLLIPGGIKKIR